MLTSEIVNKIKEYNVQSSYSHFNNAIKPPFITYIIPESNNFSADNQIYFSNELDTVQLELYSRENVIEEEKKLETYLKENNIVWEKISQTWIDEDKLYMSTYNLS